MSDIDISREGDIAIVKFNRPEARNSVTFAMWHELGAIFQRLSSDKTVKAIILCGEGSDFSAGADIGEFASTRDDMKKSREYNEAVDYGCSAISNATKPVVAACNGYCLGGAAHIAMSCDFRFAQTDAQFGIPAAKLSIVYGLIGTRKLLSLVGISRAKHILYSGERFSARYALEIGFVDRICEDPIDEARKYAIELAKNAPLSIEGAKYMLNAVESGHPDMEMIDAIIDRASSSDDYLEGRAAFAEKRLPRFRGE